MCEFRLDCGSSWWMNIVGGESKPLGNMFWKSFTQLPTHVVTCEWFILAPLLPAPLQQDAHDNFRPLNCNQVLGLCLYYRDLESFNYNVFSFINDNRKGQTDVKIKSLPQVFLKYLDFIWNILSLNFTHYACFELVWIRNLKLFWLA